jgi:YfiH family protein
MRRKKKEQRSSGVAVLRAANLRRYRWLAHGFSTRQPEPFNLNYSTGEAGVVARNRRAFLRALDGKNTRWQLTTLHQRHTDHIQIVTRESLSQQTGVRREKDGALKLVGDAAVTDSPGLLLAVQVADCLPILLADPEQRVVAAVHAGWRGTVQRIAEKTVGRMQLEFGCRAKNMLAAMGPGIDPCCYRVGAEVVDAFESQFDYAEKIIRRVKASPSEVHWQQPVFSPAPNRERRPRPALTSASAERLYLDLVEANRRQLRDAGAKAGHIWVSELCTACRTDLLFSHRAEEGRTGRMMGAIGIRPGGQSRKPAR